MSAKELSVEPTTPNDTDTTTPTGETSDPQLRLPGKRSAMSEAQKKVIDSYMEEFKEILHVNDPNLTDGHNATVINWKTKTVEAILKDPAFEGKGGKDVRDVSTFSYS